VGGPWTTLLYCIVLICTHNDRKNERCHTSKITIQTTNHRICGTVNAMTSLLDIYGVPQQRPNMIQLAISFSYLQIKSCVYVHSKSATVVTYRMDDLSSCRLLYSVIVPVGSRVVLDYVYIDRNSIELGHLYLN